MTDDVTEAGPGVEKPHLFKRLHLRLHAHPVTGVATKVVISVVGLLVILLGVVMSGPGIPGPGLLVIVAGLAILSTEWAWAERLLKRVRAWLHKQRLRARDMDPAVRRRRIVAFLLLTVLVLGGLATYLYVYGWPGFAVRSWDWLQGVSGAVPDLPGM